MKKVAIRRYKYNKNYIHRDDDENGLLIENHKKYFRFVLIYIIIGIILVILFIYIIVKLAKNKNITTKNTNNTTTILDKNLLNTTNNDYLNYINVAYSIDNNYHYLAHISMKSIMLSQYNTTFINFYILYSNFSTEQKEVINKISLQHKNCKIEFIDMGNQFKDFSIHDDIFAVWSPADFFRILLQDIFPNENKFLYLDADTLIYKDLTKLYNYNITDKYYIGMLEFKVFSYARYFKKRFNNYINTGVLLCNLEELRKGNISEKFIQFHKEYNKQIRYPVNDPLNIVSHEKNGYFDPEYVVIGFCDENAAAEYYTKTAIKLNVTEVVKAYKDPYIYHLIYYAKPWREVPKDNGKVCVDPFIRFYEIARKTDYYHEILKIFPVKP